MFSSSKSSTLNANASDGGILTLGGIAPLTFNEGLGVKQLLLIGGGLLAVLLLVVFLVRR